MTSLETMRASLRPLGLYRLDGSTLVDAELAAYAAGLDALNARLDTLEREAFVATAQDFGLTMRETLAGHDRSDLPLADRRAMLLSRGGITPADNTRQGIEDALAAVGLLCSVVVRPADGLLYVNCLRLLARFADLDQARAAAQEFLPAHLDVQFDFRPLSWDFIGEQGRSFDEMDAAGLTWNQIDQFEEDA